VTLKLSKGASVKFSLLILAAAATMKMLAGEPD
jgi:hypothetical protein